MNPNCELDKPALRPLAVEVVRVQPDASADDVCAALVWLDRLAEIYKEAKAAIETDVKAWICEHGPVRIGEILWWVGGEKKPPKCVDVPGASEALLMRLDGDWQAMCEHFASSPIKYGAFKATMGEEAFAKFFRQDIVDELHAEPVEKAEKAEKKLRKMNTAFLPK
jgi:hypothetical protein